MLWNIHEGRIMKQLYILNLVLGLLRIQYTHVLGSPLSCSSFCSAASGCVGDLSSLDFTHELMTVRPCLEVCFPRHLNPYKFSEAISDAICRLALQKVIIRTVLYFWPWLNHQACLTTISSRNRMKHHLSLCQVLYLDSGHKCVLHLMPSSSKQTIKTLKVV